MLENMPNQQLTLAKINQRNEQFWLEQSELLNKRIQDPALCEIAMSDLSAEEARMVPVRNRQSLEQALAQAEKSRTIFQRSFSAKGEKAAKADGLGSVSLDIVRAEPDINAQGLLYKIRKMTPNGPTVVLKVDRNQIHFEDNGKEKTARVSGLKDRLSRAKKKMLSR